jgi:hypothetical protein
VIRQVNSHIWKGLEFIFKVFFSFGSTDSRLGILRYFGS